MPKPIGQLIFILSLCSSGFALWNLLDSDSADLLLQLPGLIVFPAIGVGALVARQLVRVSPLEMLVSNSPALSRRFALTTLQSVEQRDEPPRGLKWPFGRLRVYALVSSPGVLLTMVDGSRVFVASRNPRGLTQAIRAAAPHVQ